MKINLLGDGDESVLQRVFTEAGDYFLSITGRAEPDPDAAEREIRACSSTPGRAIALLSDVGTDEAVGAIGWWRGSPEPNLALLGMILIIPTARAEGRAHEAIEGLEGWLAEQGITGIRSAAGAGDTRAHTFLTSLGFAPLDERKHVSLDRGRMMIALFEKSF
ncbi:MAG TPA: GNAT family N-acetyltransferase [Longimicrobiaceae bacterium]|nr:GNAT family N-acetyltransferase [Longimicrobiaceae bacterium]